jgi:hypothetical protein
MNRRNVIALVVATVASLSLACEQPNQPDSKPAENCPGATQQQAQQEYHPRVLRGRVLAPHAKLAGSWLDVFVSTAHAAPLEDEQPVSGATVELYQIDASGAQIGDVLRTTQTNAKGEWCVGLPDGVDTGTDLMLRASSEAATLRRLAASEISTDIYTGTEALVRILEARDVDFHQIPTETYVNMEAIADSAVDLLDPVELTADDDVPTMVAKIRETVLADERFSDKLSALPKRNGAD